jgi:hypothetical protein
MLGDYHRFVTFFCPTDCNNKYLWQTILRISKHYVNLIYAGHSDSSDAMLCVFSIPFFRNKLDIDYHLCHLEPQKIMV